MENIFNVPAEELEALGVIKGTNRDTIYREIFNEAKKRANRDELTVDELVAGWYEIGYKKYGKKKKIRRTVMIECSQLCLRKNPLLARVRLGVYKLNK